MYFEASVRTFPDPALPFHLVRLLKVPRELKTQKDALAFSSVVDANALTDKLK